MACREFEMGKVMAFPIVPFAFFSFASLELLQFVRRFPFIFRIVMQILEEMRALLATDAGATVCV